MQQINLYDASLKKQYDPWTRQNLLLGMGGALVLCIVWGGWAHLRKSNAEKALADISPRLEQAQTEVKALTQRVADYKPDSRLQRELSETSQRLTLRTEVLAVLQKGLSSEATRQADWLRGLARQVPTGLWLTGFSIDTDSGALEIRGRTLDPALIAEYVKRLNAEPAFNGRTFAALNITASGTAPVEDRNAALARPNPAAAPAAPPARPAKDNPPPAGPQRFHEFVLSSEAADLTAKPGARP